MEERLSGPEDSLENMHITIKENAKCKKILTQNNQEIQDKMRRPTQKIIGIGEIEDLKLKRTSKNLQQNYRKKNFPNLKKELPMTISGLLVLVL